MGGQIRGLIPFKHVISFLTTKKYLKLLIHIRESEYVFN